MVALTRGSVKDLEKVLHDDPEAAQRHFDDYQFSLPLCWAARNRLLSVESIRLLLVHGANPNEEDCHGRSVLSLLCAEPDKFRDREYRRRATRTKEIQQISSPAPREPPLVQLPGPEHHVENEPLSMIPAPGLIEAVKLLLAAGADPCRPDLFGESPLTVAAVARCTLLEKLLRHASRAQVRVALTVSVVAPTAARVATPAAAEAAAAAAAAAAAEATEAAASALPAVRKHRLQLKSLSEQLVNYTLEFC